MSAITFTSHNGEATVNGRERAYGAALAARLTAAVLDLDGRFSARNRRILPDSFFQQAQFERSKAAAENRGLSLAAVFVNWAPVASMIGEDAQLRIGTQTAGVGEVVTNTAIVGGSDPVNLLARIHASAEDGLLVEAQHTNWLAGIIETGVKTKVLRDHAGWGAAAELLRVTAGPVLITTQVSVSAMLALAGGIYFVGQSDEARWAAEEAFESLPFAEQWDRTIVAYRDARGPRRDWWLTLSPQSFPVAAYQDGLSAFDAVAAPEVATTGVF